MPAGNPCANPIYVPDDHKGSNDVTSDAISHSERRAASAPGEAVLTRTTQGWALSGILTIRTLASLEAALEDLSAEDVVLDLADLSKLDTSGAYALEKLRARLSGAGKTLSIDRAHPDHLALLARVQQATPRPDPSPASPRSMTALLDSIGRSVAGAGQFVVELVSTLGLFLARLLWLFRHPAEFRVTALVHHCDQVGWRAIPIVALMSFLIGVVLAFQGSVQLRQFGAEIFVVDLIAISILRELGILLTAIIVAGRTASSFTAAIGSMKMREEIDAMRTLAIDPATVLFVPRILALLITLPILGMIANAMGLFGGAMMAWIELGISPGMFLIRLLEDTSVQHVFVGFVKAPVFALIIGIVGCHAGMGVGGDAESLGRQTSAAVVRAIFAVILADALFSVFFALMEI